MANHNETLNASALEATMRAWFCKTGGGGLILPTGWFGRPYDNLHVLTEVIFADQGLTLVLDSSLILRFSQYPAVESTESELLLRFLSLRFEWQEYGSKKTHQQNFGPNVVRFVATA